MEIYQSPHYHRFGRDWVMGQRGSSLGSAARCWHFYAEQGASGSAGPKRRGACVSAVAESGKENCVHPDLNWFAMYSNLKNPPFDSPSSSLSWSNYHCHSVFDQNMGGVLIFRFLAKLRLLPWGQHSHGHVSSSFRSPSLGIGSVVNSRWRYFQDVQGFLKYFSTLPRRGLRVWKHRRRHSRAERAGGGWWAVGGWFFLQCPSRHEACTFSTSQLPKAVGDPRALPLLTSKCSSRHNGVQFFISHLAGWLRTRYFSEPTFRPSAATRQWKNTVFRDFPASASSLFWLSPFLIFSISDLLPSNFLHVWASYWLCFSICPYCRRFSFQTSFSMIPSSSAQCGACVILDTSEVVYHEQVTNFHQVKARRSPDSNERSASSRCRARSRDRSRGIHCLYAETSSRSWSWTRTPRTPAVYYTSSPGPELQVEPTGSPIYI